MKKRMEYGYVRPFSYDQNGVQQLEALKKAEISPENIYADQAGEKIIFQQLKTNLRAGDVVVVKNLNQLGYTYRELLESWTDVVKGMNAHIRVLDLPLVDTTFDMKASSDVTVSDIFLQFISYAVDQERLYIRKRQAEGIAYARERGRHLGRPRIPKPAKFDEMYALWRTGHLSAEEAMDQLGLKRSTFERFVKEKKEEMSRVS